jgi:hypothetical protein
MQKPWKTLLLYRDHNILADIDSESLDGSGFEDEAPEADGSRQVMR